VARGTGGGSSGVYLDVAASNANAIEFYGHLGFAEVRRLTDSILMGLRL
jgi:ribosomal protein S18 acetylase RimI-like enzyme